MRSGLVAGRVVSSDATRPGAGHRLTLALGLTVSSVVLVGCSVFGSDDSKTTAKNAAQLTQTTVASVDTTIDVTTVPAAPDSTVPPVTWTTLAPGLVPNELEVIDLIVGTGPAAEPGATLLIDYVGQRFASGEQFESTAGQPPRSIRLGSNQVIQGWEQGLIGMQEGGRRELVVPADLAYGSQGTAVVSPNEALVYVINLVKVVSPVDAVDIPVVAVEPGLSPTELGIVDELVGGGALAIDGSAVSVRYVLLSATTGQQVYSGWETGLISQFTLGTHEVVAGLEQGIAGMKTGGRRRLEVPADLAYGDAGSPGGEVLPGEAVVYLVELVSAD